MNKVSHVFWQDQAEYYFVCGECYEAHKHEQWAGSTLNTTHWAKFKKEVYAELERRIAEGDNCEWCEGKVDWQAREGEDLPFTSEEFENLLDKASQPLEPEQKPGSKEAETSESPTSGDCSGNHTHSDSPEGI